MQRRRAVIWLAGTMSVVVGLLLIAAFFDDDLRGKLGAIRRRFLSVERASSQESPSGKSPPGRWRAHPSDSQRPALTAEQIESIRQLESLGYLDGYVVAPEVVNVTHFDRERAYHGLNLLVSGHGPEAILMDMEGRPLHAWRYGYDKVWPHLSTVAAGGGEDLRQFWRSVHLFENGDLLAIFEGIGMIKLDADSNLLWDYPEQVHHDQFVAQDDKIYTLTRKGKIDPRRDVESPILEDFIAVLDSDGRELRKVSILNCVENSRYTHLLKSMNRSGDLLHTNFIQVLDGRLADRTAAFAAGNVVVSLRYLDAVCVIDLDEERVVWALTGQWRNQHEPAILENGNLLVFDNEGLPGQSRILELDPFSEELLWEYVGTAEKPFHTIDCGTCARLPNGNTLITESNAGRAFEVAPDRSIVWEFASPYRAGPNLELVATLFEVTRLRPDFPVDWMNSEEADEGADQGER